MKHFVSVLLLTLILLSCKDQSTQNDINIETNTEDLTDAIQVNTIHIGSETTNDKNRFHTSYPSTVFDFINTHQEEFAKAYLKEFQNNITDGHNDAVAGLDFGQHFEIIESTPSILGFLIERYTSYGNNYDTQYFTHLYDLAAQERLEFSSLFYPQELRPLNNQKSIGF